MADLAVKPGSTGQTIYVFLKDSSVTTGAGKASVTYNGGLTCYYVRAGAAAAVVTLASQTAAGVWASGGWAEVDATHCVGLYRFDVPDAALAAGVRSVTFHFQGASGASPAVYVVDLLHQVDVVSISGTAQTGRDLGNSVLVSYGTGSGQINLAGGNLAGTVDIGKVNGASVTVDTAQDIAAAVWTDLVSGSDFSAAGGIGSVVTTNLNATVSSRAASGAVGTEVWAAGTRSLTDKAGFALSPAGLNAIDVTPPAGLATGLVPMLVQLHRRFFKKVTKTSGQLRTYADDGATVVTTQATTDDGTTKTQGAAG